MTDIKDTEDIEDMEDIKDINFISSDNVTNNYAFHKKLGVIPNNNTVKKYLRKHYKLKLPDVHIHFYDKKTITTIEFYEELKDKLNESKLDELKIDELKINDPDEWTRPMLVFVGMIFNDLDFINKLKKGFNSRTMIEFDFSNSEFSHSDFELFIHLVVANSDLSTIEATYNLLPVMFHKPYRYFIEAVTIGNTKYFDWFLANIWAFNTFSNDSYDRQLFIKILEARWLEYIHLFPITIKQNKKTQEYILDYLTNEEMTKYNLHFYNTLDVDYVTDNNGDIITVNTSRDSAIVDEKNVPYYGFRSLSRVLYLYPNRTDLYKNAVINSEELKIIMRTTSVREKIEANSIKELEKITKIIFHGRDYSSNNHDEMIKNRRRIMGHRAMDHRMIGMKFLLNIKFLLVGIKIGKKIIHHSKFNYNIFLNVYKKLTR